MVDSTVDCILTVTAAWREVLLLALSGVLKLALLYVQLLDHYRHRSRNPRIPGQLHGSLRLWEGVAIPLLDHVHACSRIN